MTDLEKEFAKEVDFFDFGTDDPEEIREILRREKARLDEKESSFGAYLKQFRLGRGLRVPEMAEKAGVAPLLWRAWESNLQMPTEDQIRQLAEDLFLLDLQRDKLLELRRDNPVISLRRLYHFRPQSLAARGVGSVQTCFEWQSLDETTRDKLVRWGQRQGVSLPDELPTLVERLQDRDVESWVREVLESGE